MEENKLYIEIMKKMEENEAPLFQYLESLVSECGMYRVKLESEKFKYDFRVGESGNISLVSLKAVIRTYGRDIVVPITEDLPTYEAAREWATAKARDYVRARRREQGEATRRAAAKRQRRYNQRKREAAAELERRQ